MEKGNLPIRLDGWFNAQLFLSVDVFLLITTRKHWNILQNSNVVGVGRIV